MQFQRGVLTHADDANTRVVQRRNRPGNVGAVVVLVGVPPAGATVVLAGDVAASREVLVTEVIAGVDDADLAGRRVGAGELVSLDHLDAVGHKLTAGVRRTGRRRGAAEGVALDVLLDVLDVRVAGQSGDCLRGHLDGNRIDTVNLVFDITSRGSDGSPTRSGSARLERDDDTGGVLRSEGGGTAQRGGDGQGEQTGRKNGGWLHGVRNPVQGSLKK